MADNKGFKINITENTNIPKFRQIVDSINDAIAEQLLDSGNMLPSVNQVCQDYKVSRDTVFKAYSLLKEQGIVESVPNKGYFVARAIRRVFLFLDTFKAYKEVLYDSFVNNLPKNIIADVHFHHYKPEVFRRQIEDSIGKYSKYVIMPFAHKGIEDVLGKIPDDKLLIIDWNVHSKENHNLLYQDFGQAVYDRLSELLPIIKKYNKGIEFLYPEFTKHPYETVEFFEKFCKDNSLKGRVLTESVDFNVEKGMAYFSVSDRMLGRFLEQCRDKEFKPGEDCGIISYNETPMKKFIYEGITVISTDFYEMGKKAAEFASSDIDMKYCVPTLAYIRKSL